MMTIPRRNNNTIELNSQQVRSEVLETVGTEFELQVNGYKYKPNGIWDPLLYTSASGRSIRYSCMNLENFPSYSLVNTYLKRSGEEGYGTFLILLANS